MSSSTSIVLYPPVDSRDLGPQHVDIHLFSPHAGELELEPGRRTGSQLADRNGNRLGRSPECAHAARAHLCLATSEGPSSLTLSHPVSATQVQLAPGLVEVESVRRSTLTLYTFGAVLSTEAEVALSTGHIFSDAPILLVNKSFYDNDLNPIDLVVNEFQAWLSILRARALRNMPAFYRQLQTISSFTLYQQALILAQRTLGSVPVDERSERYWRSSCTLTSALRAAQQRLGASALLPNLEQLLRIDPSL
jgi:hypothetical protein